MSEPGTMPSAQEQLAAIGSLDSVLDRADLDYWLFGGWAVDLWVGALTREHDDIDVASWRSDYDAILRALEAAGWRHTPTANDVVGTRYQWHTAQAEFTFVEADDDGRIVIPIPDQHIVWSEESLGEQRRGLGGVSARTIPLALLRSGKSAPREGAAEGAKDRADFDALSRLAL